MAGPCGNFTRFPILLLPKKRQQAPEAKTVLLRRRLIYTERCVMEMLRRDIYSQSLLGATSHGKTVFPIWDMIFGTRTDPMLVEARETGIDRDPIPRRFLSELLSPLIFHRLVRRSLLSTPPNAAASGNRREGPHRPPGGSWVNRRR